MKRFFYLMMATLVAMVTFTSCDDEDEAVLARVQLELSGEITGSVNFNGTLIDSDASYTVVHVEVQPSGKAQVVLDPATFNIQAPGMGLVQIAMRESLVINEGLSVTQSGETTRVEGRFEQMVLTSFRGGEPMPMLMKGKVTAVANGEDSVELNIDVTQWGSMPFPLVIYFSSLDAGDGEEGGSNEGQGDQGWGYEEGEEEGGSDDGQGDQGWGYEEGEEEGT